MSIGRAYLIVALLLPLSPALAARGESAPVVVASIPPVHALVAAVMDGVGSPHRLMSGRESPHTFNLRPSDVRLLNRADLLFWIGPDLERPLKRVIPTTGLARAVALIEAPGLTLLETRGGDKAHGHGRHDDHHDDAHATIDSHIWLSPSNALAMTQEVTRRLAESDPAHASLYRRNAAALGRRLSALDEQLRARLAGIDTGFAVAHDAFQYFEHHYGLRFAGSISLGPERRPGAAHLRRLLAEWREKRVRCLFSEPQFASAMIDMLSAELDIRHAVLDPLGAAVEPGPSAYAQTLRALVDSFVGCMQAEDP